MAHEWWEQGSTRRCRALPGSTLRYRADLRLHGLPSVTAASWVQRGPAGLLQQWLPEPLPYFFLQVLNLNSPSVPLSPVPVCLAGDSSAGAHHVWVEKDFFFFFKQSHSICQHTLLCKLSCVASARDFSPASPSVPPQNFLESIRQGSGAKHPWTRASEAPLTGIFVRVSLSPSTLHTLSY